MKIYFAGGLFDHKELAGNALLAAAIGELSDGKYECILPQNFESRGKHPKDVRNADIDALLSCDAALFNYDGTELDSGTVVEYMFAKFADKPAVLLRTDFRGGGDCADVDGCSPWNLMSSFYPRTRTLILNAGEIYAKNGRDYQAAIREIAGRVVKELDSVTKTASTMPPDCREKIDKWLSIIMK